MNTQPTPTKRWGVPDQDNLTQLAQDSLPPLQTQPGGSGFPTLLFKELKRFWKVGGQTMAAPVLSALLYLLVFAHILEGRVNVYDKIPYTAFLIPGLMMMSMLQNAFANPSSSLVQSRMGGNLIFILLPPLSHWDIFAAYLLASIIRGLVVGIAIGVVSLFFIPLQIYSYLWVLTFAILSCGVMGALGIIAGLWSEKFDQLSVFQNFLIMPATFLSGVFYSIHSLPPFWQTVSHWNPIFYTIDGFRYGFFAVSDASPWHSLAVVGSVFVVLCLILLRMLISGYKLRN